MAASKAYIEMRRKRVIEILLKDNSVTDQALRERFGITRSSDFIKSCRVESGVKAPDENLNSKNCKTPERFPVGPK